MYSIGINLGQTALGKMIPDGGGALSNSSDVIGAIAEERVTRKKRSGGYSQSIKYLKEHFEEFAAANILVYSTCCEPERSEDLHSLGLAGILSPHTTIISCNHHLSHALSVFCTSPYEEAIVGVFDAGGNVLENKPSQNWWLQSREQASYYHATMKGIKLISRDFFAPREAGYGEIYRALTYFLGWESSQHSGNSMTLAGLHLEAVEDLPIFIHDDDGRVRSVVGNNPKNPVSMISRANAVCGIPAIDPRPSTSTSFDEAHLYLAAAYQKALERSVAKKMKLLSQQMGVRNICLAGGVAYNCPMVSAVEEITESSSVFVHPASGDQGQCLGNSFFGLYKSLGSMPKYPHFSPFLGARYAPSLSGLKAQVSKFSRTIEVYEASDLLNEVAEELCQGSIVAWFTGRSEYGPRALGNRSLLAHPQHTDARLNLNNLKSRYGFTPVAPVTTEKFAQEIFGRCVSSPFMTSAMTPLPSMRKKYPSIVHSDGTSRVQTVTESSHSLMHRLLQTVETMSGPPILLNTSLNARGSPIVETTSDFLEFFVSSGLSIGVIEGFVVRNTELSKKSSAPSLANNIRDGVIISLTFSEGVEYRPTSLQNRVQHILPSHRLKSRSRFALDNEYINWVTTGRKVTTIRYTSGAVDFPTDLKLDVVGTDNFEYGRTKHGVTSKWYKIGSYTIKQFGMLNEEDGRRDGFSGEKELKETLQKIYGNIEDHELVTIYGISEVNEKLSPAA